MFSGLYGDLPQAKDESEKKVEPPAPGSWSGSGHLAPTAKRPAGVLAPPSVLRTASAVPPQGRGRGRGSTKLGGGAPSEGTTHGTSSVSETGVEGAVSIGAPTAPTAAPTQNLGAGGGFWDDAHDEYDPARPNDYEDARKQREKQRLEAEAESERQERLREIRELEVLEAKREAEQAEQAVQHDGDAARRAALSLSGEDAYLRRGGIAAAAAPGGDHGHVPPPLPSTTLGAAAAAPPASTPFGQPKGMGLAQKMLEKMGWKAGEGLGRHKQGIAAPLKVEKTDARSGRVVAQELQTAPLPPSRERDSPPAEWGAPTTVVVLRNVVSPGEIDESLDEEVGIECSKHGEVTSVLIFEVTEPGFPEEEAVRIFVQFSTQEAATAALTVMHGRFFGGRTVRGAYFDEERFEAADLAPRPGEVPLRENKYRQQ